MPEFDFNDLSFKIQEAYERKKLDEVLEFYHPLVTVMGTSMKMPVKGIEELKRVLEEQFNSPRRSMVKLSDFSIKKINEGVFTVVCRIEGRQMIYYSSYGFKGWLSRAFVVMDDHPRIIFENLTLEK